MIALPNGCYCSELKVFPKNWKTTKAKISETWYIHYRFYDPLIKDASGKPKPKQVFIKQMNRYDDLKQRQLATEVLLEETLDLLRNRSYNPNTKQVTEQEHHLELDPETPVMEALEYARKKLDCVPVFRRDIKYTLKYVGQAMTQLRYSGKSICEIETKHMVILFDYLRQDKTFTNAKHNRYRAHLKMLFKPLKKLGCIKYNPVDDVDITKKTKRIRKTLTKEQRAEVAKFLKEHNYNFYRFAIIFFHSGGRETELVQLKGKDVNLSAQTYRCLVKKGRQYKEIERTIKTIALPLWQEALKDCGPEDYVFSEGLVPGSHAIDPRQITRRWRLWIKGKLNKQLQKEGKPLIDADFYSLKHSNTSEMVDLLGEQAAADQNGHSTTAMVVQIYDVKRKDRKHEQLKKANNQF